MKVSAYKMLITENKRNAMIFDLTERFPRGPKAKLRAKHYTTSYYRDVPESEHLIGGELGYDIYELYELTKEHFYHGTFSEFTTRIEGAAMGRRLYDYANNECKDEWELFKRGPQTTRRIRRLESRLRRVRDMMAEINDRNLYALHIGRARGTVYAFGDSPEHVSTQYNLLLSAGFEAAADAGYISRGYYNEGKLDVRAQFDGPSHGPHEIMAKNQEFIEQVDADVARLHREIAECKAKIAAAEDLKQLVNMFTINSCAQEFGDEA